MKFIKLSRTAFQALILSALLASTFAGNARAQGCIPSICFGSCENTAHVAQIRPLLIALQIQLRAHITMEFQNHQRWLIYDFFWGYVLPSLRSMAAQLTTVGMQQVMIFGSFLDAKNQLETQTLFQDLTARAHKDYHSSTGMCQIGTAAISMAAGYRNAEFTAILLSKRSLDRQMGAIDTVAAEGRESDREGRIEKVRTLYCDPSDNNYALRPLCASVQASRVNKDIDFAKTIGEVRTIDVDFSDANITNDEADLIALSNNIFSHDVFERLGERVISADESEDDYFRSRAVVAKRSVVENSFYSLIGMKAAGSATSGNTGQFARNVFQQLGASPDDAGALLGPRPSYFALLEAVTQRIYQDPEFYTDLYDKPANVERKDVAMQALGLMVDRDKFKSELRTESLLAVLLELEINKYQKEIHNRLGNIDRAGKKN